jgi:hypothetical protein
MQQVRISWVLSELKMPREARSIKIKQMSNVDIQYERQT